MNYKHIKQLALLGALVLAAVGSYFSGSVNPYYLQVVLFIGINITLATSLNLINGYTGQFSLGHAGFMAIGAYASRLICQPSTAPVSSRCWGARTPSALRWSSHLCSSLADSPPRSRG